MLAMASSAPPDLTHPSAAYSVPLNRASEDQTAQPGTPDPAGKPLTLEEALSLAEQQNPLLQGAIAQTEGAQAGIDTSRAYPNPQFNFLAGHQHARPILTPGVPGLLQHYSASQSLDLPSVRRSRLAAAKLSREASLFGLAGVRRSVRATVKQSFYEVLHRKEQIKYAEENLKLVEDLRRRTGVQVDVGEAARLELTRAEAEIATAQTLVKSARLEYIAALSVLRAAISAPLPDDVQPVGTLTAQINLPTLESLRRDVLANHPALAQTRSEIERSKAIIENEKALRLPQPTLNAEYEQQPDLGFYRVGVSIPVPVWDRRKGPIGQAQAALKEALALSSQRRLEITASLERAYGLYEVANQQVISFEAGALRQAQAALQASESAYKFGERGIIEVLDAQRVLQSVRGEFLNAQYERQAALIDLEELGALSTGGKK
jgi:cobalt-zinc-cadmium efflux system outer membrane protein